MFCHLKKSCKITLFLVIFLTEFSAVYVRITILKEFYLDDTWGWHWITAVDLGQWPFEGLLKAYNFLTFFSRKHWTEHVTHQLFLFVLIWSVVISFGSEEFSEQTFWQIPLNFSHGSHKSLGRFHDKILVFLDTWRPNLSPVNPWAMCVLLKDTLMKSLFASRWLWTTEKKVAFSRSSKSC